MNPKASAFRVVMVAASLGLIGCSDDGDEGTGDPSDEITLADPAGTHAGHTYGEWAGEWWNWLYSNPASANPALDETGEFAGEKQTAAVFFLAGNFGGTNERTFDVPADKALFFPIVTIQADNCGVPEEDHLTSAELQSAAEDMLSGVTELTLSIDDESFATSPADFSDFRLPVTPMSYDVPADDSLYDLQGSDFEGTCAESYTTGYFVMIDGLPAGEHTLHFTSLTPGATAAEDFAIDVTDHITAE